MSLYCKMQYMENRFDVSKWGRKVMMKQLFFSYAFVFCSAYTGKMRKVSMQKEVHKRISLN